MRIKFISSFFISLLLLGFMSTCMKDGDVPLNVFAILKEDVTATATKASFKVYYEYAFDTRHYTLKRATIFFSKNKDVTNALHANGSLGDDNYGTYFQVELGNLEANTTYYYYYEVANAVNSLNTEIESFTTNDYGLPTVTTVSVSNVTSVGAKFSGNVSDGGDLAVTERGFCCSTSTSNLTIGGPHVVSGSGLGSYTSNVTGLSANTTYYMRAYAKNSKGVAYGSTKIFTTTNGLPVVTTNNVTNVTSTSASCGGNVTSDGGYSVTARGVCWSTSSNPTINNSHTNSGTGTGSFNATLTGLTQGTTYYVRAYATNSKCTTYGTQKSFTTTSTSTWIYYDNGSYNESWGLTAGGSHEWGIMFPSSIMSSYGGMKVSQIKAYFSVTGSYTLHLYQGTSSSSPSTQLLSQSISVYNTGWQTFSISPVNVSTTQNLWVTISTSYNSGVYPCCATAGTNNPNARWSRISSGTWYDFYTSNGGVDLTWMIRILLSPTKGEKGYEVELPQVPVESSKGGFIPESSRYVPGIDKPASQCSVRPTSNH